MLSLGLSSNLMSMQLLEWSVLAFYGRGLVVARIPIQRAPDERDAGYLVRSFLQGKIFFGSLYRIIPFLISQCVSFFHRPTRTRSPIRSRKRFKAAKEILPIFISENKKKIEKKKRKSFELVHIINFSFQRQKFLKTLSKIFVRDR